MSVMTKLMSPFRKVTYQYRKEAIAFDNLLLSGSYRIIVMFTPLFLLILGFFIDPVISQLSIEDYQTGNLYLQLPILLWIRVVFMIVITLIFSMKLQNIVKDGRLGYWLVLGIERREFILYSVGYASLLLSLSILQLYIIALFLTSVILSLTTLAWIFVSSLILHFFLINITMIMTELVENVELAIFLTNLIYLIGAYFSDADSTFRKFFVPEYLDLTIDSIIVVVIMILASIALFWLNIRSFMSKNIELGG